MRNREPRKIKVISTKNNGKSFVKMFQHWERQRANQYRDRQQVFVNSGELFSVEVK